MRTEVKVGIITALVVVIAVIFVVLPMGRSDGDTATVVPFDATALPDATDTTAGRASSDERAEIATPRQQHEQPTARHESLRTSPPGETARTADRQPARPPAGPSDILPSDTPADRAQPEVGPANRDLIGERIDREYGVTDVETPTTQPAEPAKKPEVEKSTPYGPEAARPEAAKPPAPGVPVPKKPGETKPNETLPGFKPTAGVKKHVISKGDTLWGLAEFYYGDGRLHKRILAANPGLDENKLIVGREIVIPSEEALAEKPAQTRPGTPTQPGVRKHTYVVERGDTLIKIARNVLKDESRWREIYELNKDKIANPDVVPAGLELKLPE